MKVFISWSGPRSKTLAEAFHKWLPVALQSIEAWISSNIQAGERWSNEVAEKLEECHFGILCITRENINAPWILFEAGALSKSVEKGRVILLLFDLDKQDIPYPLGQFQAKKFEEEDMRTLFSDLNNATLSPLKEEVLNNAFSSFWNSFEPELKKIPPSQDQTPSRTQGEILEELVSSSRNVELGLKTVREIIESDAPIRRRQKPGFRLTFAEMLHEFSGRPNDPVVILIAASLLKEDFPWLFEVASELYKTSRLGSEGNVMQAKEDFFNLINEVMQSPLSEELGKEQRRAMHMLRDILSDGTPKTVKRIINIGVPKIEMNFDDL